MAGGVDTVLVSIVMKVTLGGGFTVKEFMNSHCHFLLLWNQHCSKSWDVADTTVVRKVK